MGTSRTGMRLDPSFFEALENQIRQAERVRRNLPMTMDRLARFSSYAQMGYAQRRSAGPVDPRQQNPEAAWKIPVRRISGRYFFGWQVRRAGVGIYQMRNDSREAFYIEFGIHQNAPRRQRRPINKLSLMDTLKFLQNTHVWHRVWASLMMPPPGQRTGKGFHWKTQSGITEAGIPVMQRLS